MVIHDMRGPTVAIKSGLKNTLRVNAEIKQIFELDQSGFVEQCKKLHDQVKEKGAAL